MNRSNIVLRKTSFALLIRAFGAISALLFQLSIARLLGPEATGIYFYTLTIVMLLSTFGRFGFDKIITKQVAVTLEKNQRLAAMNFIVAGGFVVVFLSVLIASVLALVVANGFFKELFDTSLYIATIAIVFVGLSWYLSGVLIGTKQSNIASSIQTLVTPLVAVVVIHTLQEDYGDSSATFAFMIGSMFSCALGFVVISKFFSSWRKVEILNSLKQTKLVASAGMHVMIGALSNQLTLFLPIFFLSVFATVDEIGVFSIAQRMSMMISLVLFASNIVLAPRIASMWSAGDRKRIQSLSRSVSILMLFVALPLVIPMIFFPDAIMGLFGVEFAAGGLLLSILAVSQLFNVLTSSVEQVMIMTGYEKLVMKTGLVAALICCLCASTLIPLYGAPGAAVSSAVAVVALNGLRVFLFWRKTKINVVPNLYTIINIKRDLINSGSR